MPPGGGGRKENGVRALVMAVLVSLLPPVADACGGALPTVDWGGPGGVDWSTGFVTAYGIGSGPANLDNPNLRRAAALKAAYLEATRSLLKACLEITIRDNLTVRDYLRADPELQKALRERISELPPWSVRLEEGGYVRVAVRMPLGGEGGLTQIVGAVDEWGDEAGGEHVLPSRGSLEAPDGNVTGIVILASRQILAPALRPRIMDEGGRTLVTYQRAGEKARSRPAFVAYYHSLNEALQDPVVAPDPVVVSADQSRGAGTDLILPRFLEEDLLLSDGGRRIIEDVLFVVVLQ